MFGLPGGQLFVLLRPVAIGSNLFMAAFCTSPGVGGNAGLNPSSGAGSSELVLTWPAGSG
jgi:hypothetical protein